MDKRLMVIKTDLGTEFVGWLLEEDGDKIVIANGVREGTKPIRSESFNRSEIDEYHEISFTFKRGGKGDAIVS